MNMTTNRIKVLDCTLRDGGYVNDWKFGDDNAKAIVNELSSTGIDYIEVGFIKLCDYEKDKIQFNQMSQVANLFKPIKQKLSLIVEVGYGYPVELFPRHSEDTVDLVRVIMWKRMLKEGLEYCKQLIEKGYEVGVQATRTEQYSDEEFADFVRMFSSINPKGIYIVDTFGLLDKKALLRYAEIADANMGEGICLGYHAHNNMQQAFSNAVAMSEHIWSHDIMLDASVFGMGRGAGNLCLELLLNYLNTNFQAGYDINPIYNVAEKYIIPFFNDTPWGYSLPYQLSALNGRNPSYVDYIQKYKLSIPQTKELFETMNSKNVGITFDTEMCDELINKIIAH